MSKIEKEPESVLYASMLVRGARGPASEVESNDIIIVFLENESEGRNCERERREKQYEVKRRSKNIQKGVR